MKRLFVIRIGVVIESHKENPDASWGDTNVFEDELDAIHDQYPDEFAIIDINGKRVLREDESNSDALDSLV